MKRLHLLLTFALVSVYPFIAMSAQEIEPPLDGPGMYHYLDDPASAAVIMMEIWNAKEPTTVDKLEELIFQQHMTVLDVSHDIVDINDDDKPDDLMTIFAGYNCNLRKEKKRVEPSSDAPDGLIDNYVFSSKDGGRYHVFAINIPSCGNDQYMSNGLCDSSVRMAYSDASEKDELISKLLSITGFVPVAEDEAYMGLDGDTGEYDYGTVILSRYDEEDALYWVEITSML